MLPRTSPKLGRGGGKETTIPSYTLVRVVFVRNNDWCCSTCKRQTRGWPMWVEGVIMVASSLSFALMSRLREKRTCGDAESEHKFIAQQQELSLVWKHDAALCSSANWDYRKNHQANRVELPN